MLVCSRCREEKENLIITEEDNYCPDCYELEECDMVYGRGQAFPEEVKKFFSVLYYTVNINGVYCVLDDDNKIDGYICRHCHNHVYRKSPITGLCVDCAGDTLQSQNGTFTF